MKLKLIWTLLFAILTILSAYGCKSESDTVRKKKNTPSQAATPADDNQSTSHAYNQTSNLDTQVTTTTAADDISQEELEQLVEPLNELINNFWPDVVNVAQPKLKEMLMESIRTSLDGEKNFRIKKVHYPKFDFKPYPPGFTGIKKDEIQLRVPAKGELWAEASADVLVRPGVDILAFTTKIKVTFKRVYSTQTVTGDFADVDNFKFKDATKPTISYDFKLGVSVLPQFLTDALFNAFNGKKHVRKAVDKWMEDLHESILNAIGKDSSDI